MRRRTPCVDGWFGPKLTWSTSSLSRSSSGTSRIVGTRDGMREPSYCPSATTGQLTARGGCDGRAHCSSAEADRLAADRIVLAQRVALPVLGHEQPLEVRVAVEDDPHQVELLALVPVAGRPDGDDARHVLALVDPALQPRAGRPLPQREQVVADREAFRLDLGQGLEALRHRMHEVAAARGADVAGDALAAPAEVVGRDEVDAHVEAELVACVLAGLADLAGLDRHRRHLRAVPVRDVARYAAQSVTSRPRSARTRAARRPGAPRAGG